MAEKIIVKKGQDLPAALKRELEFFPGIVELRLEKNSPVTSIRAVPKKGTFSANVKNLIKKENLQNTNKRRCNNCTGWVTLRTSKFGKVHWYHTSPRVAKVCKNPEPNEV